MITHEPEYYTVEEVAELLRVSQPTIRRWIRAGTLRAERVGGRTIRIRREDVRPARAAAHPTIASSEAKLFPRYVGENPLPLAEWIDRADADRARLLRERGGKPFPPSLPLIHEARAERDERL